MKNILLSMTGLILSVMLVISCSSNKLLDAAVNGDTEYIKSFRGDINEAVNKDGSTALMFAAFHGKLESVKALIGAGANINATNSGGHTALMYAAFEGRAEVVNELINDGANVNIADKSGLTALTESVIKHHKDIVEKLIKAGAKK
jgi:uncharacterized protein